MALTATKMTRIFHFSGIRLSDPNDTMRVDEVKTFYAAQYAQLATAAVNGLEAVVEEMRYTSEPAIGSKGDRVNSSPRSTPRQVLPELEGLAQGNHVEQQTPLMRLT
jgi:PRTRC genetic system protein C